MKKELCIDTFNAVTKRYQLDGCILHSDRGSQYTSESFRETLSKAGVDQSLSGVDLSMITLGWRVSLPH